MVRSVEKNKQASSDQIKRDFDNRYKKLDFKFTSVRFNHRQSNGLLNSLTLLNSFLIGLTLRNLEAANEQVKSFSATRSNFSSFRTILKSRLLPSIVYKAHSYANEIFNVFVRFVPYFVTPNTSRRFKINIKCFVFDINISTWFGMKSVNEANCFPFHSRLPSRDPSIFPNVAKIASR